MASTVTLRDPLHPSIVDRVPDRRRHRDTRAHHENADDVAGRFGLLDVDGSPVRNVISFNESQPEAAAVLQRRPRRLVDRDAPPHVGDRWPGVRNVDPGRPVGPLDGDQYRGASDSSCTSQTEPRRAVRLTLAARRPACPGRGAPRSRGPARWGRCAWGSRRGGSCSSAPGCGPSGWSRRSPGCRRGP